MVTKLQPRIQPSWRPIRQVAAVVGVSRRTLERWVVQGAITAYRVPGDRRTFLDMEEVGHVREPS